MITLSIDMHLFSATFEAHHLQGEDSMQSLCRGGAGEGKSPSAVVGERKIGSRVQAWILCLQLGAVQGQQVTGISQDCVAAKWSFFPYQGL